MSTLDFQYVAVDRSGAKHRGTERGATREDVCRKLARIGLTPLDVRERKGGAGGKKRRRKRVRGRDVAHFTYQFSVLVDARIPLSEGLMSIAEQETNETLKGVLEDVALRIESGESVAQALGAHERVFGSVYVETVRAAETSGTMSKVLEHLSEMLERTEETSSQIRSALMYPACVVGVLSLGVTFLIGFVIPRFATMFEERGVDLPALTRVMMGLGESVQGFWWAYLAGLVGLVFGARAMWNNPRGRLIVDGWLHRVPVVRSILIGLAISRFSRVFGITVGSGLSLIDAIGLSGRASGRPTLMADSERMAAQVRSGGRLAGVLGSCTYLTPFARRMLSAGEESAELGRMCSIVARHYERETTRQAKNIATVIEPVMVVLIALVVLVVALSIFLPMWNMVTLMQ